jgi:hypothetical protein
MAGSPAVKEEKLHFRTYQSCDGSVARLAGKRSVVFTRAILHVAIVRIYEAADLILRLPQVQDIRLQHLVT